MPVRVPIYAVCYRHHPVVNHRLNSYRKASEIVFPADNKDLQWYFLVVTTCLLNSYLLIYFSKTSIADLCLPQPGWLLWQNTAPGYIVCVVTTSTHSLPPPNQQPPTTCFGLLVCWVRGAKRDLSLVDSIDVLHSTASMDG